MTKDFFFQLSTHEALELISQRVAELLNANQPVLAQIHSAPADEILGKAEVSRLLKVSLTTLTNWMRAGIIPFYRKNRRVFFKKTEVLNSLQPPKHSKCR